MKEELNIEELLNSYVDGELSVRQRTEVKRMAANDPDIAERLKQLQKCRMLVSALPVAHAPVHIMQNVRASLEARANADANMPVYASEKPEKTRFILLHRVLASAAMIALAAVLVLVINMLTPSITDNGGGDSFAAASDMRFSGRLELKTNDLKAVNSVINRAIENSGFANSAEPLRDSSRYVYTLNCSREGLNKILFDLNEDWDKLSSAEFFVDTKVFGQSVEIEGIMPSQIAAIVNQKDTDESVKIAKDVAVGNSLSELLPESNIYSSGGDVPSGMFKTQPIMVKNYPAIQQEKGQETIQLRIILSR